MNKEILIVGGGPVGLTAALMLARHDVPVRIIDQNDAPTTLSKALIVWKRTLQSLDPVIPWETFADGFIRARRMNFIHAGHDAAFINLQETEHNVPSGILIPQSETESILLNKLHASGIEVERNTKLVSFTQNDEEVVCKLSIGETIHTPFLIGCDGAHSTIRHTLNVPFLGDTLKGLWDLADVSIDSETEDGVMYTENTDAGTVAIFPVSKGRIRIISDAGKDKTEKTGINPTLSDVQHILDTQSSLGLQATHLHWSGEYITNQRQVKSYVHGRVFIAGDAAHVHSPAGGQGMNLGMQDACNIAWKLACVAKGSSKELLETYQEERHPIGKQVLAFTRKLVNNQSIDNPFLRIVNELKLRVMLNFSAVQHKLASVLCEDVMHYRDSPLSLNGGGGIFPDELEEYKDLRGNEATLFCKERRTCSFGPLPLTEIINDTVVSHFGGDVLVRPDGYVAAVGSDAVHSWLTRFKCQKFEG